MRERAKSSTCSGAALRAGRRQVGRCRVGQARFSSSAYRGGRKLAIRRCPESEVGRVLIASLFAQSQELSYCRTNVVNISVRDISHSCHLPLLSLKHLASRYGFRCHASCVFDCRALHRDVGRLGDQGVDVHRQPASVAGERRPGRVDESCLP